MPGYEINIPNENCWMGYVPVNNSPEEIDRMIQDIEF